MTTSDYARVVDSRILELFERYRSQKILETWKELVAEIKGLPQEVQLEAVLFFAIVAKLR